MGKKSDNSEGIQSAYVYRLLTEILSFCKEAKTPEELRRRFCIQKEFEISKLSLNRLLDLLHQQGSLDRLNEGVIRTSKSGFEAIDLLAVSIAKIEIPQFNKDYDKVIQKIIGRMQGG